MEGDVLKQLQDMIDTSQILLIKYGVTGQKIDTNYKSEVITFSSNSSVEVDYKNKKATMETVSGSFKGSNTSHHLFENNFEIITKKNTNGEITSTDTLKYSNSEYEELFKSGGKLLTIEVKELIPVESQLNNTTCQVCIPSKKITDKISDYIKSTYAIFKNKENQFDITIILSQLNEETKTSLMQYCNIIIEKKK